MKATSGRASTAHLMVCPLCASGEVASVGPGFARCGSCSLPLLGSALQTLRDIVGLPDAVGSHACEECGHPEMRLLPDGVFHCPACRSEVLPFEAHRGLPGNPAGSLEGHTDFPAGRAGGTIGERS